MFEFKGEDPGYIVVDELAGMFITMAGHRLSIINLIAGFLLFRIFDIIKPYPAYDIQRLRKGYGIMADDVIAGIYANIVLWAGYLLFYGIWK